jgi:pyrophosphate--fructose-6-phosphate 1-phosphotransferase
VRLDDLNPGQWFAEQLKGRLSAEKVLVQKSGYFARSARPSPRDLELIRQSAVAAAEAAIAGTSGLAALDIDKGGEMAIVDFARVAGGKPFDIDEPWFGEMLEAIGQPKGNRADSH